MPVMRALIFAYAGEMAFSDTWDEYLYGSEILVAPVTTAGATSRKVVLPAGRWLNYNSKKIVYEGGKSVAAEAALGTIPLFVKEGAIIPRGDVIQLNNNWDANWKAKLRIELFPAAKTESKFEYFTGERAESIRVTPVTDGIGIEFGDLGTDGTLEVYTKNPKGVTAANGTKLREGKDYRYDRDAQKLTIEFHGATKVKIVGATSVFAD